MVLHKIIIFFFCFVHFSCTKNLLIYLSKNEIKQSFGNNKFKPTYHIIKTHNGPLHYTQIGDTTKPLFVFVHGAPGRWYGIINILTDSSILNQYNIITYDRPGFGNSNNGYSVTSLLEQSNALQLIINKTNVTNKKVTLVSRSYGTAIAAKYTMQFPNKVQKLLLLASCVDPVKEKYFWFAFANKMAWVNSFMYSDINNTTDEKFAHKRELKIMQNDWKNITVPTYIVHGTNDKIAYVSNAFFAEQKLVNAYTKMFIVNGLGHNITQEKAALVIDIVLDKY
jgi:pimeloyl-ACP methyl ester carboxylesterase